MYAVATVPILFLAPRGRLIQWVAIATAIGLAAQLFVQIPTAAALNVHWHPDFNFRHPALRQFVRLALPLLAYLVVANASLVIERNVASKLYVGAISVVNYASRLFAIPGNLLIMPLAVVFSPTFAREAARERRGNLERELRDALRITVFLALPVTFWMAVHALPLTRTIFERGQFDFTSSTHTAGMLMCYSLGLLPNALAVILLRAFYAIQDTVTPLLAEGVNVACYAWVAPLLARHYGLSGLGVARAGSFLLVALILLLVLRRKLSIIPSSAGTAFLLKIACSSLAMGVITWGASWLLTGVFQQHGFGTRALVMAFLGVLGGVVYFGICYVLRVREVNSVLSLSQRWLPSTWKLRGFGESSV
jgi:putative peptidoglycan lipid II flippase